MASIALASAVRRSLAPAADWRPLAPPQVLQFVALLVQAAVESDHVLRHHGQLPGLESLINI